MSCKPDGRRRWAGALFLALAVLMIGAGETFLNDPLRERPLLTLVYWLLCFACVILAMLIALLDYSVVRRRTREEERGLVEETLQDIAREKAGREAARQTRRE